MVLATASVAGAGAQAPDGSPRAMRALRIEREPIRVEGRLTESAWQRAESSTGFTQRDPADGSPATERTEVRVLVSDDAIYVGVRAFDSDPSAIVGRLARRDELQESDLITIYFDSFHDHRTCFLFGVTPRGSIRDAYFFNDRPGGDTSWDPVWQVGTSVDSLGWVAEFRIPLTQLRFDRTQSTWGFQVRRVVQRKAEDTYWAPWSRNDAGAMSLFGHLEGLTDLPSPARLELRPYIVADGRNRPEATGSLYAPTTTVGGGAGFDLKYGLSSDFTLDLTANPDFGQVEADPAVVNLSAFESFFPERRPFFVEGSSLFNQGGFAGQMFYSRRIGRPPQGWANPPAGGTVEIPEQSTIISAAKVTGKTGGGLGLGLLSAVTMGENGTLRDSLAGVVGSESVQPWVHHFAGRVEQDFGEGQHTVGVFTTALHRFGGTDEFGLRRSAYSLAVDGTHRWNRNTFGVEWNLSASHIRGTEDVILAAQRSSLRYYQRPDADHLTIDTTRTSLSGYTFAVTAGKQAGTWQYYVGYGRSSPGYDINDMGFQRSVGQQAARGGLGHSRVRPVGPFRNFRMGTDWNWNATTGGEHTGTWFRPVFFAATFRNNWGFNVNPLAVTVGQRSVTALRGGPSLRQNAWRYSFVNVFTDRRKPVSFSLGGNVGGLFGAPGRFFGVFGGTAVRPSATINVSVDVGYNWGKDPEQWVTRRTIDDSTRYILATIRQQTLNTRIRFDWTLTPRLSFQLYTQPFVSAGAYSAYLEVTDPNAEQWAGRFHRYGSEISCDADVCAIDRDGDGTTDASFGNPDFNFKSLRATAVLRWEYVPGSVLYVAWQHGRSEWAPGGTFGGLGAFGDLFGLESDNTLLIKINYWLGL